jgi:hypothetical protein
MKFIFTTFLAALLSATSYGQSIKYHDVHPDTTINTWNDFMVFGIDIWWHPSPEVVVKSWGDWEVLCSSSDTLPLALNKDEEISENSTGSWMKVQYRCLNCYGAVGHWTSTGDKYLAARNKSGSGWVYGWARLSIAANGMAFTIKDYAIQANDNMMIKAGQMIGTGIGSPLHPTGVYQPRIASGTMSFPNLPADHKLVIYDLNGHIVYSSLVSNRSVVDILQLPSSIYILRFSNEKTTQTIKIAIR